MQLRDYQSAAVSAAWSHLCRQAGNPVISMPTGSGKSLVIAQLGHDAVKKYHGRVVVICHRKELIQQDYEKIKKLLPDTPIGVYSAGLKQRSTEEDIVFAGIQSAYNKAYEFGKRNLVIVDENHLVPHSGDGMYRKFFTELRAANPQLRVIGLTATPYRLDSGPLCRPDGLFQKICYSANIHELIEDGYLCNLVTQPAENSTDTSGLRLRGGEFIANEEQELFSAWDTVRNSVREIVAKTKDRKSVLIFTTGCQHGMRACDILRDLGQEGHFVFGDSLPLERESRLQNFKSGRLKYLINCDVLTTGFDAPNIDAIAILRATMSPGLYAQIVGRGFRVCPSKQNCIAEGQRILTDCGLVPIEQVTTDMRVWDGCAFVHHQGTIFQGEQEVIDYAGLTATPDHKVWTKEGWKAIGECAVKQTPVSVTAINGQIVRETDGYFRYCDPQGKSLQTVSACAMQDVRREVTKVLHESYSSHRRMPTVRTSATRAEVACATSIECERPLHQSQKSQVERLWWERDTIPLQNTDHDGGMDSGISRPASQYANRQNRQQRPLRGGQSTICNAPREHAQHPALRSMRVWDILNAGPRRRFTCEGLLVSNCAVLDFGGNIKRHGPIDSIDFGRCRNTGDAVGEAPTKTCPNCEQQVLIGCRECDCGFRFPEPKINHDDKADQENQILSVPESWMVEEIRYSTWAKKKGDGPLTMRVDYFCQPANGKGDMESKTISEWVCIEHDGFAKQKAAKWWKLRSIAPMPFTVDSAVELARCGAVASAERITTVKDGRFYRITNYVLDEMPQEWLSESSEEVAVGWTEDEVAF